MKRLWREVTLAVTLCLFAIVANAQGNYTITVTIDSGPSAGSSATASFSSANALFNSIRSDLLSTNLGNVNPAYMDTQDVTLDIDLNGATVVATVVGGAQQVSTLTYGSGSAPGPDTQATRLGALDWVRETIAGTPPTVVCTNPNGCGTTTPPTTCTNPNGCGPTTTPLPIQPPGTPTSPVDPFCGNPGALCNRMVDRELELVNRPGRDINYKSQGAGGARKSPIFTVNPNFSFWSGGGVDITLAEVPFTYISTLRDPRYAIIVDAPITLASYNGDQAVSASIGAGLRLPMTDKWIITPVVRVGAMASTDLDLNGYLWSASLVSGYETKMGEFDFSIGNQLTHIRTIPISSNDYDHQNTVLRNGIGLAGETDFQFFGKDATWEALLVNTQWFGDDVYVSNQTDLGISIGTQNSDNGVKWDSARLGVTLTFTDREYSGFSFNFGYKF